MKIYGFAPSPNTWKCRALAAHLQVPLDYIHIDLTKGEQRAESYLALNPGGRTPTLVDGDFTLWESTAIMHYIASKKPGSSNPSDTKSQCDILRWQSWQLAHWGSDACNPVIFQRMVKQLLDMGPPDQAVVEKALGVFEKEATILNAHLEGRSWLVSDNVTLADFSVGAPLLHAEAAQLPVRDYPNIQAWFQRLAALPCWAQSAPEMASAA